MKQKSLNNSERRTRNSSRGRSPAREAHPAATDAASTLSQGPTMKSPQGNEILPQGNVNKVCIQAAAPSGDATPSSEIGTVLTNEKSDKISVIPLETDSLDSSHTDESVSVMTQTESNGMVMGDNGASGSKSEGKADPPETSSERALHLVLSELREIRSEMTALRKIEETTANISKDLAGIGNRTTELEEAFEATSARVRELGDEVSTLKSVAHKHDHSILALKKMKTEISSSASKNLEVMTELIETQKGRVETFHATADKIKDDISGEVNQRLEEKMEEKAGQMKDEIKEDISGDIDKKLDVRFEQLAQASHFQSLREQAFNNRFNLVISGLPEDAQKSTPDLVLHFLESTLQIKKVEFASAFRMGPAPVEQQSYTRPILVRFRNINLRNKVWRKRQVITGENDEQRIRITADLPRELKEGVQMLYRVAEAASKFEQFRSARIFNYQLELDGKVYLPSQLEELPMEIRPSTLSTPRSENSLAFFTRKSILSNHFPSKFIIEGETFHTMEQYLAVKRAIFSNHPEMIRKAKTARDPRQAKYVLNTLKEDRSQEWYEGIEDILLQGLRAKFSQNSSLCSFLINTNQLLLGEASKDPHWGIGMTLEDPEVLNSSLWLPEGNLLGRSLMKVRGELPWNDTESL